MPKLSNTALADRVLAIDAMKKAGADTKGINDIIQDSDDYEDFLFAARRMCLQNKGVKTDHLPLFSSYAESIHKERMKDMFDTHFGGEPLSTVDMFAGCNDIREKLHRLSELNDAELAAVEADPEVPTMLKRYAHGILFDEVKVLNEILNQAMGKPVERVMVAQRTANPLDGLSTEELRRLLTSGE